MIESAAEARMALRVLRLREEREATTALTEYQDDPVGFAVDHLGIREETLRWSLNPGYKNFVWDGTPEPIVAIAEALVEWKDVGVETSRVCSPSRNVVSIN